MAIFADYKKITTEYSEETELQTTTYPLDLGETNPDYNLRGQTVELEVPITTTTEEILENVYVQIISYMFYNSKEQREADFNDFVFEEHILGRRIEENAGDDLRNLGYDLLKNEPIFSNCIDDL